ncbi:hypothetical protein H6G96_31645 [Nostoc sp. FACHB-892]|uniref:hypothetical protein n=1 Tax=Nostoc sp. FACHB-892 TaxID=2692843 RepID=UPI001684A79B|nr:hypothetical protein [Nostoc sp. FACHB-892]MBD2730751.1 hypothetical protein [Nostoc sp. FACHB-892]
MTNADFVRVRRYSKPSCNSAIVPQENSLNQYLLSIHGHQLTEVIGSIESTGITGDLAIFMLANLQSLEVGA